MMRSKNGMDREVKRYFKNLDLVREDIREEFDLLTIPFEGKRICDFGCGNGITTFGLALEAEGSECMGMDLFDEGTGTTPAKLNRYIAIVETECQKPEPSENIFPESLCRLVHAKRTPQFIEGNIVLGENLLSGVDLAYCKKLLINLWGKKYGDTPSGEAGLVQGLKHITESIRSGGWLCVIEYEKGFKFEKYFEACGLQVIRREQIKRREVRAKGRTNVLSKFALYLSQKPM